MRWMTRRALGTGGATGAAAEAAAGQWLASRKNNRSKHYAELFLLYYSACWIASVGVVIAFGTYEWWGNCLRA